MLSVRININKRGFYGYDYKGKTCIKNTLIYSYPLKQMQFSKLENLFGLRCISGEINYNSLDIMLIRSNPKQNVLGALLSYNVQIIADVKYKDYKEYCIRNKFDINNAQVLLQFIGINNDIL